MYVFPVAFLCLHTFPARPLYVSGVAIQDLQTPTLASLSPPPNQLLTHYSAGGGGGGDPSLHSLKDCLSGLGEEEEEGERVSSPVGVGGGTRHPPGGGTVSWNNSINTELFKEFSYSMKFLAGKGEFEMR